MLNFMLLKEWSAHIVFILNSRVAVSRDGGHHESSDHPLGVAPLFSPAFIFVLINFITAGNSKQTLFLFSCQAINIGTTPCTPTDTQLFKSKELALLKPLLRERELPNMVQRLLGL